ncbi:hypothetical protein PR202_ga25897 [Eleusine coracana subsp. coracana]|uniref:SWIM-type domain-containing protein n=1 Tax=Eleusine coracana subsp. coracana TaxID=191504 RepID=A0AAV5DC59_ELECO|nr:hypothetical protein QOZ80_3AG0246480 [Eleusine coracana subsp. coracana]GJN08013.1 hypothetical protein PR202_ga25897 [Eleusine coracana subsp. coracana]
MNGGESSSPVMTDSERRAYRYGQAASRLQLQGMRKSWSNDSLASSYGARATCVCAPTTHPGSFRCKHHRHIHTAAALQQQEPSTNDAGAKHQEAGHADQEKSSS